MLLYSKWVKTEYVASVSWHAGTPRKRTDSHNDGTSALRGVLQLQRLPRMYQEKIVQELEGCRDFISLKTSDGTTAKYCIPFRCSLLEKKVKENSGKSSE